jgi:hypothetical protein
MVLNGLDIKVSLEFEPFYNSKIFFPRAETIITGMFGYLLLLYAVISKPDL